MLLNSFSKTLCHVENEPKLIAAKIDELMLTPLIQADKTQRDIDFAKNYGNENNARKILGIIGI